MDEEKSFKASTEENKAVAEGDLAETVKGLAQDNKALAEASSSCMTVAADREAAVKSRNEEPNAIATAKKILNETSSGAVSQSYSFLLVASRTASNGRLVPILQMQKLLAWTRSSQSSTAQPPLPSSPHGLVQSSVMAQLTEMMSS